jgi:hypothetical protein
MKRQAIVAAVLAGGTAVLAYASPGRADDSALAILSKMSAAQVALTSFVMTTTAATSGVTSVATVVRTPSKTPGEAYSGVATKVETAVGSITIDTYIVDSTMYLSMNGSPWQKKALTAEQFKTFTGSLIDGFKTNPPVATLQPDRVDGGVTYGDVRIAAPTPASLASMPGMPKTLTLECMYDKATYLMHECDAEQFTMTFSNFNDPANVVVLPAAAANATPLMMPLPGEKPPGGAPPAPAPSSAPAH